MGHLSAVHNVLHRDCLPAAAAALQVVMIGDGLTDLEAVQVAGGADLFIGCVSDLQGLWIVWGRYVQRWYGGDMRVAEVRKQ